MRDWVMTARQKTTLKFESSADRLKFVCQFRANLIPIHTWRGEQ